MFLRNYIFLIVVILNFSCGLPTAHQKIQVWFDEAAQDCDINGPLHKCSRWSYLDEKQYDDMIMFAVDKMDPPIADGQSIFDMGMGVGAPFKVLKKYWPHLKLGSSDLAENALAIAQEVFPDFKNNFYAHDMTTNLKSVPDNSQDHVISVGALGMYLTKEGMKGAIAEAVRMSKPGGSMLFTQFIEPDAHGRGSIITPISKEELQEMLRSNGVEKIRFYPLDSIKNQYERYLVVGIKKI